MMTDEKYKIEDGPQYSYVNQVICSAEILACEKIDIGAVKFWITAGIPDALLEDKNFMKELMTKASETVMSEIEKKINGVIL
jgi:hypothetical protein